ncbi:tagatose 1,6-diphosphate aldolase [Tengunoibacter tsumagoiensis]|uniref:tagatose-bisphosphate aldolase n=1 Tax=Tengunoibacter tsumagoiensis TaxID=2014871 RepID=A0A402A466_9CHLR|nr:tagatose 1,6-diphosphate aldolase [Tengunoibacter tsumagoiensis]GCE13859.1 tagatose 1,6-diphosphate aldolase [Tengunoibacter tsumagoiensis]
MQLSQGKRQGLQALSNGQGIIAAAAMDQRTSLQRAMAKVKGSPATESELREFKLLVTEALTPYTSAILLDPHYSLEVLLKRAPQTGVLLSYEQSGYDHTRLDRLPHLLPEWSVKRLQEAGADAIKVLLYYDPDQETSINRMKQAVVERVGAECVAYDLPFFLEIITYSAIEKSELMLAQEKPLRVQLSMQEFSRPGYHVDVLKIEVPVDIRYVAGSRANLTNESAYTHERASQLFAETARSTQLPFIYLSAGVKMDIFIETLQLAAESSAPYYGVLCGRASWQDCIPIYLHQGRKAAEEWLQTEGVENVLTLHRILEASAQPWWQRYPAYD